MNEFILHIDRITKAIVSICSYTERLNLLSFANLSSRSKSITNLHNNCDSYTHRIKINPIYRGNVHENLRLTHRRIKILTRFIGES
jgi:hypothetical protein